MRGLGQEVDRKQKHLTVYYTSPPTLLLNNVYCLIIAYNQFLLKGSLERNVIN